MEIPGKNLVRCSFGFKCGTCGNDVGMIILGEAGFSEHDGICTCGAGVTFKVFLDGKGRTEQSTVEVVRTWQATPEQMQKAKEQAERQARMKQAKSTLENPFAALHGALAAKGTATKVSFKKHKEEAVQRMADAVYKETKGEDLPEAEMKLIALTIWQAADPIEQLKATVAFSLEGLQGAGIVLAGYQALKEEGRWSKG